MDRDVVECSCSVWMDLKAGSADSAARDQSLGQSQRSGDDFIATYQRLVRLESSNEIALT